MATEALAFAWVFMPPVLIDIRSPDSRSAVTAATSTLMAYPFVCTQVVAEGGTSKEIGRRSPRHGPARLRSTLPASSSLVRSPLPAVTTSRLPPAATAREIATSAATSAPPISSSNSGDIDGRCGRSFAEAQPKLRHVPDFSLIGVRRELVKPGDLMLWATQPIGFPGGERGRDRSVLPL